MTPVDTEHLTLRLTSLGDARSEAEARLIAEARRELTVAELHTVALNAGMSLAADFVCHAEANVESLLYAIRVLRGVA
jgi:hypothetical protein